MPSSNIGPLIKGMVGSIAKRFLADAPPARVPSGLCNLNTVYLPSPVYMGRGCIQ